MKTAVIDPGYPNGGNGAAGFSIGRPPVVIVTPNDGGPGGEAPIIFLTVINVPEAGGAKNNIPIGTTESSTKTKVLGIIGVGPVIVTIPPG